MPEDFLRKPARFTWNHQRTRAAVLLAEDELSDEQIAQRVGVCRRTLSYWKENPVFAAQVGDHIGQLQAAMLRYRVAKKRERIKVLDDLHTKMLTVIDERAEDLGDEAPGGSTGLLVRQLKQIGYGESARTVEEYAVDAGLVRELRAVHEQAAKELGQWVDKSEVDERTTMVEIVGIASDAI